jgi:uncharacterized protein
MPLTTAQKIVDFSLAVTPLQAGIRINLFGGEPLICFGLLSHVVDYMREQEQNLGRRASIGVTTNGTLLTESMHDFVRIRNVDMCISVDGPQHIHDRNRVFSDGRGSFDVIMRNLHRALAKLDDLQVNAVYGPDSVDCLPDTVDFLIGTPYASCTSTQTFARRRRRTAAKNCLESGGA